MPQTPAKSKRIIALDLIRGYFLLVILINHLNRFPGFFDLFTARGQLWTSAAEGFFLISGLLVGMIRGGEARSGRFLSASKKMVIRGFYLYFWTVFLTLFFTIIGSHYLGNTQLKAGLFPLNHTDYAMVIRQALDLHYIYGWADFLQFYAVYMVIGPIFLWLLYKRLWQLALVATVGFFGLKSHSAYFIWQLYFFGGILIGYYWQEIGDFFKNWNSKGRRQLTTGLYSLALLVFTADVTGTFIGRVVQRHHWLGGGSLAFAGHFLNWLHSLNATWFNRFNLALPYGWARVVVSLIWFSAIYLFVRAHEETFKKYLGRLLLPVGCNPLLVYGFSSAVIFFSNLFVPHKASFAVNVFINGLAIGLVWGLASAKDWYKKSRTIFVT